MAELFQHSKKTVSEHLTKIFEEGEVAEDSVVRRFRTTAADGKHYDFLKLGGHDLLTHAGRISAEQAHEKAHLEYDRYRKVIDDEPSRVDKDLDEALKHLPPPDA